MTNLPAWLLLSLLPTAALKSPPIPMPGPAPASDGKEAPPPLEQRLPLEQRARYRTLTQKCGRCHGPEKALDATFKAEEWDGYLERKLRHAGAGISERQREEIAAFLKYWAKSKR